MDNRLKELLNSIKNNFTELLGENLTGIYIHGSVAFGCFNWDTSDVDFIVVTETQPDNETQQKIIELLLKLDKSAPPKGLEMSMVTAENCRNFVYPTPYYLHFSNSHKESYIQDCKGHLDKLKGTDKDLAAHFTVINHVGITLCGKDKADVFAPVPAESYLDSIRFDVENAAEEICDEPVYLTLNLCRVLAFIRQGKVLSKADGGRWGIENLPQFSDVISTATDCYAKASIADFDNDRLKAMADYILKEIFK